MSRQGVRRQTHRHPAIRQPGSASERVRWSTTYIHRWFLGPRPKQERLIVGLHHIIFETGSQEAERFVTDRSPPVPVDTKRSEFGIHPANPDTQE